MATKSNNPIPVRAIHPGEILREELQERGIKQKDFAQQISVQPTHLNAFIKGKRNLNEDLAMKLEQHLGIPFKVWMNLQNSYTYDCIAIEKRSIEEQEAFAFEEECSKILNLKHLYKCLLCPFTSVVDKVRWIKDLFPFDLLTIQEQKMQVAGFYKHSEKVQIDEKNMLTWLVLNWLTISQISNLNSYEQGNALKAAEKIASMANQRKMSVNNIKGCLQNYGISLAEVPKLDKAPIDAYSTIVNGHPIITVTYRYNDMDKLAFDILHELCHIDRHLSDIQKAFIAIEGVEYSSDPREKEANEFAKNTLIPETIWNEILKVGCNSLSPHKIVKTIATEAERYGISPSIAVSRYKHDTNWYKTSAYRSPKIFD